MKLKYFYGTMASGKSATLLMNVHQKENSGVRCAVLKPSEKRDGNFIKSRIGLERECISIQNEDNLSDVIFNLWLSERVQEIFIDECQFLTSEQVEQLWKISRNLKIQINCFGLKTTYRNELFDSIKTMFVFADISKEIEPNCSCKYCSENATTHILIVNNEVVWDYPEKFEGDIVGETRFESVCQDCFDKKTKNVNKNQ